MPDTQVAVIGAGLSGLACARALSDAGLHVTVFDKGRGAGGRMSTRRTDHGAFDHGAQYFTARDPEFQAAVAGWVAAGVVAPWLGNIGRIGEGPGMEPSPGERYVGVPGMSRLLRHAAGDLAVDFETPIMSVERFGGTYTLRDESGRALSGFDRVVVAVPAPQAVRLLSAAPLLAERAAAAGIAPCWSVMACFDAPVPTPLDGVFIVGKAVSWAARDSSKPGRAPGERWMIHGHWEWSAQHLEDAHESVSAVLMTAFFEALGVPEQAPSFLATHRWRYALPVQPLPEDFLYDAAAGIGACGDWCNGPRVEGAWMSGAALARAMLNS